jgi:hypothetical protein
MSKRSSVRTSQFPRFFSSGVLRAEGCRQSPAPAKLPKLQKKNFFRTVYIGRPTPVVFAAGRGTWDGSSCQVGFLFFCVWGREANRLGSRGLSRRRSGRVAGGAAAGYGGGPGTSKPSIGRSRWQPSLTDIDRFSAFLVRFSS